MKYIFIGGVKEIKLLESNGVFDEIIKNGKKFELREIDNSVDKNKNDLILINRFARYLYSIEKSNISYSYYHSVFERISITRPVRAIIFIIIAKIFNKIPNILNYLRIFLEKMNEFSFKVKLNNSENDVYIFLNIMSTNIELNYYYKAIRLKKKRILVQTYWDNISSKLYVPKKDFDLVICWGLESEKLYRLINSSKSKIQSVFPYRINYINKIKLTHERLIFLYTPSQKKLNFNNENLITLSNAVHEISKNYNKEFSVIYRPHPYSKPQDLPNLSHFTNIFLDKAYKNLLDEDKNFINNNNFQEISNLSLISYLGNSCCLLSQAGTLCLEARFLSIPVIVLLNEPYQVTLKLGQYMTHFNEIFCDPGVYTAFNQNQLFQLINKIDFNKIIEPSIFIKNSISNDESLSNFLLKL